MNINQVIKYGDSSLTFIALRNVNDGSYISYKESKKIVEEYNIPIVKEYDFKTTNMEKILNEIANTKEVEGFVLRFEDDRMYKIKSGWYREIHNVFLKLKLIVCYIKCSFK